MTFAQQLSKLMDSRALTNYQLAKDLDIHPTTVANWLSGKIPRKKTLSILADYFGVSVDYLLGNAENEKKPLINEDEELTEYLEELKNRPEMRMLFSLTKGATKEDVEKAVRIIEAALGK